MSAGNATHLSQKRGRVGMHMQLFLICAQYNKRRKQRSCYGTTSCISLPSRSDGRGRETNKEGGPGCPIMFIVQHTPYDAPSCCAKIKRK